MVLCFGGHAYDGEGFPFAAHVCTKEDFKRHQRTEWSGTEEAQAKRLAWCQDTLELLVRAAAQAEGDPPRQRLPALMDSFMP